MVLTNEQKIVIENGVKAAMSEMKNDGSTPGLSQKIVYDTLLDLAKDLVINAIENSDRFADKLVPVALKVGTKSIEGVVVDGVVDAVSGEDPMLAASKAATKTIIGALATAATAAIMGSSGILVVIVGAVVGVTVVAAVGDAAADALADWWNNQYGPEIYMIKNSNTNSVSINATGSGKIKHILKHHYETDLANKSHWTISEKAGQEIITYTDTQQNRNIGLYTFSAGIDDLKKHRSSLELILSWDTKEVITISSNNYVSDVINYMKRIDLLTSIAKTEDTALYALLTLRPYVLKKDIPDNLPTSNSYSDSYLKDRLQFLKYLTSGDVAPSYYYDADLGESVGDKYYLSGDFPVQSRSIIFSENGNIQGSGFGDKLYGGKGNNVIRGDIDFEGQGADYIEGGLGNDTIYGGGGNDTIYTNANILSQYDQETDSNTNIVHAGSGNDMVMGSKGSDVIYGDFKNKSDYALFDLLTNYDDTLYGNGGADALYGGKGDDKLYGGTGADIIDGGDGDDILKNARSDGASDNESDMLKGGEGYDKYYVGNMDIIQDADRRGIVIFEGTRLLKGIAKSGGCNPDGSQEYYGDGGVYILDPKGTLTFKKGDQILTIEKYVNGALGINLFNESPGGSCPPPPPNPGPNTPKPDFPSPLVLDLNGDGVTSTFISSTSTYFDLDNDGVKQRTGWVQSDDALLALDKNQDGIINDASELFGNHTTLKNGTNAANGFEALKEYDENKDGVIDAKDNIYNTLSLWQDANSDGVTDTGELHTLTELGVKSINLDYTQTTDYEEQNRIFQTSSFTTTDGTTQSINDVWFATESRDTAKDIDITLKDTVAALPDFRGAGRAGNLSTAMNENTALETAVTALLTKSTTLTYDSLLGDVKNILALWTHTDNISATAARGEQYIMNHNYTNMQKTGWRYRIYAYARDVAILETFWGQSFTMNVDGKTTSDVIGTEMSAYMTNAIETLTDTVLATLLVQSLYGKEAYDVTAGSFDYAGLFLKLDSTLISGTTADKTTAANLLATLIHRDGLETLSHLDTALLSDSAFKSLMQSNGVTYTVGTDGIISGGYAGAIEGSSGNDTIYASTDGKVYGGEGNDIIYGTNGSYSYSPIGNATGNEELHGGSGNDTIYGGVGSDILYGDEGDDTLYAHGTDSGDGNYGHDILIGGEGNDTLVGTGRNSTYIYNYGDGFDTIIDGGNVGLTSDILELRGIRFEDIRVGKIGSDMIISIKDTVDTEMEIGAITIKNGMNSGKIESFIFDDKAIDFSTIQLIADGLLKDDLYSFDRGMGLKTIRDYGSINGDTLQFGEGISATDIMIKVSPNSNDMIIAIKEEGKTFSTFSDKLTITNWFNVENRIETFTFSDGTTWDVNAILAHQGTDEADTSRLLDTNADTTLDLGAGNDTITTGKSNDSLNGGEGDDTINAVSGNDTLIGGQDNDTLNGGAGNDTYVFNRGDGQDTIFDEDRYAPYYWNPNYILTRNAGIDALVFGEGIVANDIQTKIASNGKDLIIALKEVGKSFEELSDTITLKNWIEVNSRIESFVFADGTVWSVNDIIATQATEGDDIIRTIDMTLPHNIHLLGGDDYISAGNADDIVYGDSGNDSINTGLGNDTLIGGIGNDTQSGGAGDDTYVFAKGDGSDTIIDSAGSDTLQFTDGITQDDIVLRQEGNNLRVAIKEANIKIDNLSDSIVIKDWFSPGSRIENFSFSDGTVLSGAESILSLIGSDENDSFTWYESSLTLSTDAGNDTVVLGTGNDTLSGGTGNDVLQGGGGDDTYVFNRGDGIDTITDVEIYRPYYWNKNYTVAQDGGDDTLRFGDEITADDIIIKASSSSNDLILAIKEDGKTFAELMDKITLRNWFDSKYRIETIEFADGTVWNVNDIVNAQGTDDADTVHLLDTTSDVTLNLKDGDDTVVTGSGNDTIAGGMGNDLLKGGEGNDTYVFEKGDGIDTLIEIAGDDTLRFGNGILSSDIIIKAAANSNDLIVAIREENKTFNELTDKITLKNWFNSDNRIENIEFSDGTVWNVNDIVNAQGTEDADTIHLLDTTSDVTLNLKGGDDTVVTGSGNDTIEGGMGNDLLKGGEGNDTYVFNRGDGRDTIIDVSGSDTLSFANGISKDEIVVMADSQNDDLILAINEDGKLFDELSDKIILKDWYTDDNRIESFVFEDGTILDTLGITQLQLRDDESNYLRYLEHDNTIDALGGDDITHGGAGDDTYVFDRGSGNDRIIDLTGTDTLKLGAGITLNDLEIRATSGYLMIALKEDGKTFDEFADKAMVQQITYDNYGIEYLEFANGTRVDPKTLISTYEGTAGNDTIDINYLRTQNPAVSIDDDLTIDAKAGNDSVIIGNGNNTVSMGSGNNELLSVGDGDNKIDTGTGWDKTLNVGNGQNIINMGDGWNTLLAGDGNNTIDATQSNSNLRLGDGNNVIDAGYRENITAGSGNNSIAYSVDGYVSFYGDFGDGNNTIEQIANVGEDYYGGEGYVYLQMGDGDNRFTMNDFDTSWMGIQASFGDGNNVVKIGEQLSRDLLYDSIERNSTISVGDGDNSITVANGDDDLYIQTGSGNNTISFSADVDYVTINTVNGSNQIVQLGDTDIDSSYYNWYYDETTGNWYQSDELITASYANDLVIGLGDGDSKVSLTDTAQNYTLRLGDGNNKLTIGKEDGDNNYSMYSTIETGDGDNVISVLSGDGDLNINTGSGNNTIEFSADIDYVNINTASGNNIITQIAAVDTDNIYDYYGGPNTYANNNRVNISLGLGINTVILGSTDDNISFSDAALYELNIGIQGQANIIDVGTGSNFISLGDADNIITMGASDYNLLSTYDGEDYNTVYLGNGNNTLTLKGTDNVYAVIGGGDNIVSIANTQFSYLDFDGGNNHIIIDTDKNSYVDVSNSNSNVITMSDGSTLLTARYSGENIIATGGGADDVYTYDSNDSYIVNIGDGSDAILDMYGTDKIIFGEGITKENLKVRVEFYGDLMNHAENTLLMQQFQYDANADGFSFDTLMNANLVIQYSDDPSDVLILANWYDSDSRIESFVFNDGSILSDHQIVSLIGTEEDDTVLGTEGGNILHGGTGEDNVSAGEDNDIYLFNRGDSHDLFSEEAGFDTIEFGDGITKDDLILQKVDNNLLISLKEAGNTQNDLADTITVSNWFDESGRIERFCFADGSTMELNEILSRVDADGVIYYGTPDTDAMAGTNIGDIIMARENNDIINGNEGNDLLFGEVGDDVINGGIGDDLLYGGEGNDTYMIDRNMGNDIVFDQNGTDTLRFAEGIMSGDIEVWYDNNDLKIWVEGSEITLADWYTSEHRIETLTFVNGEILNVNDMINFQYEEVKGVSEGSTFDVDDGDTIYYAREGNDTYRISTYAGANSVIDAGGIDRIEFAEGISVDMLNLSYEGDDLIIELEGTSVRLSGWYTAKNRIESFAFTDGTILVAEEVIALMSTDGDDSIRSLEEGNYINAGDGDDIYDVVNLSGMHTIEDNSGIDTIRMGAGISPDSLRITWVQGSDDILIHNKETTIDGGLLIKNWCSPENRIETILFSDGNLWSSQDILDAMGSNEDDVYNGLKDQANILHANDGSDVISTFGFDDTLYGGAGNDSLDAGDGNDTLIGEEGDDLLFGGAGDDTYLFNRGFGKDMIFEDAFGGADSAGDDRIVLGAGIAYDDVIVRSFENDNNLYIALKEDGKQFDELSDVITIKDWFLSANRIESISFGDGDVMSLIDVMHAKAAEEGEAISALGEGGMLIGTNDEDTLIGNKGDDFILGLDGNDDLIGAEGNDTLIGGQGDDSLEGSEGNDTYFFGRGDAHDTIYDNATAVQEQYGYVTDSDRVARWSKIEHEYSVNGGTDTVYFGEGITADDLIVKNEGFDLLITLKDSIDDVLRIQDYYKPFNTIEFFGFSDGTIFSGSEFEALLFTPEDDDVTFVDDQDRILNGNEGDDTINAGGGNDIIDGAGGDDSLNGGFGDDVYLFGRGSGHDTITDNGIGQWWQTRSGNDTIFFKEGISRDDLWVKEEGNDLLIAIKEEGKSFAELSDTLRIIGALDKNNPFESVLFANGTNVSITALVNHAPEAQNEISHTLQDIRVFSGEVGATDIDGDILTYTVSTQAAHGTLNVSETGEWSYSAADGYMGTDSIVITIDDGEGRVIEQTLNFDIKVSAPTLSDSTSNLLEDSNAAGTLSVVNPIGGVLVYEILNASTKGSFTLNEAGEWNYTPNADLNGSDSVMIKVTNAYGLSTTATLNLAIEAVNDIPVVTESITLNAVAEDSGVITITAEQLLASSYDVDGDILSVSNLSVSAGTLVDNLDGTWSLTPDLDYNGTITLDYMVTDTKANAAATAIQIVTAVNDAPILIETPSEVTLYAGSSSTGSIKASDVDGDTLTYNVTTNPEHGTLTINEKGEWSYSAERYYAGESSATISIDDGHGESITTTLNFTNLMTADWHYTYSGQSMSINDNDGIDVLLMNDISMAELTFLQEGNNLRIDVQDKEDVILEGYFTSPSKGVESLQTAQGTINLSKERIGSSGSFFGIKWGSDNNDLISGSDTQSDILFGHNGNDILLGKGRSDLLYGNGGNDLLIGGESNDTLSGESGDDILYGDNGNDTLIGGEGNDKLFGGKGNDILEGGAGNDLLHGGEGTNTLIGSTGDNTYLMSKGANTTTINENVFGFNLFGHYFGENGGNDTIQFDKGITKEDISFLMRGNDLLLQYGDSEFITINNQKNQANKIERLQLDDGNYLSNTDIDQIVQQINAYSKDHGFHLKDNSQIQNNQAMMNIIASGWHQ